MRNPNSTIRIFGLQRTCTNYVEILLKKNFKTTILIEKNAWKHGYVPSTTVRNIVICTKNIYAWLISLYAYAYRDPKHWRGEGVITNKPFSHFLRSKIELHSSVFNISIRAANPIQHWNNMHFHWLSAQDKKIHIVKHETLLSRPKRALNSLKETFALKMKLANYSVPESLANTRGGLTKQRFDRNFYRTKEYMNFYSQRDVDFIAKELDAKICRSLSYPY